MNEVREVTYYLAKDDTKFDTKAQAYAHNKKLDADKLNPDLIVLGENCQPATDIYSAPYLYVKDEITLDAAREILKDNKNAKADTLEVGYNFMNDGQYVNLIVESEFHRAMIVQLEKAKRYLDARAGNASE